MAKNSGSIIDHPVLNKLPPLDSDLIAKLWVRLQDGDTSAREQLLYQLLAYVKSKLPGYIRQIKRLRHDIDGLISSLTVWILESIDEKINEDPLHWVGASLRDKCITYCYKMSVFGPAREPASKVWNYRHCAQVIPDTLLDTSDAAEMDIEILDEIKAKARNQREYDFMFYRLQGYTNTEIAKLLGVSNSTITRLYGVLSKRFGL